MIHLYPRSSTDAALVLTGLAFGYCSLVGGVVAGFVLADRWVDRKYARNPYGRGGAS